MVGGEGEEMNADKATIIRYKAYLKLKQKRCDELLKALMSANELCRSVHAIAERNGEKTNWTAFKKKLSKSLSIQHKVIYKETQNEP
jgi:hypothetical protein